VNVQLLCRLCQEEGADLLSLTQRKKETLPLPDSKAHQFQRHRFTWSIELRGHYYPSVRGMFTRLGIPTFFSTVPKLSSPGKLLHFYNLGNEVCPLSPFRGDKLLTANTAPMDLP
jgi:hypothetical protein